jgi:hypothetical protein
MAASVVVGRDYIIVPALDIIVLGGAATYCPSPHWLPYGQILCRINTSLLKMVSPCGEAGRTSSHKCAQLL